ncbi:MAG: hypothetical protein HOL66_16695 [Rhodospirillaceae bacterium]|jgi:predicted metal-binding membrane protein|nr:hypothetical protein [Rhodospirillaceae bacterium]MBT5245871.1 hypothetical protein [Rhodospirillaceae bacterium]MBT5561178.1 hypothetical protein [Rhodospirillaceae bacterium]MBT6242872.1 hypothetical protein [Rhodospirillaceae bacterium]
MSDFEYPKDENLRLILSTDQEEWLHIRIRDWKLFSWAMAIILAVCFIWAVAYAAGAFSRYDEPECLSFVGSTLSVQEQQKQIAAAGVEACSHQETSESETNWENVRATVTLTSWVLMMVSFLGLLRGLFQVRLFTSYLKDHRAFLKKYNRL